MFCTEGESSNGKVPEDGTDRCKPDETGEDEKDYHSLHYIIRLKLRNQGSDFGPDLPRRYECDLPQV